MKNIYFCVDYESFAFIRYNNFQIGDSNRFIAESYKTTDDAINNGLQNIITLSLAHLSFDLLNLGYNIYLCYKDKQIKIEPHMDIGGKDLRIGHNIFKLFRAGVFNELLEIHN